MSFALGARHVDAALRFLRVDFAGRAPLRDLLEIPRIRFGVGLLSFGVGSACLPWVRIRVHKAVCPCALLARHLCQSRGALL